MKRHCLAYNSKANKLNREADEKKALKKKAAKLRKYHMAMNDLEESIAIFPDFFTPEHLFEQKAKIYRILHS